MARTGYTMMSFAIPDEMRQVLRAHARAEGVTMSSVIRDAIAERTGAVNEVARIRADARRSWGEREKEGDW